MTLIDDMVLERNMSNLDVAVTFEDKLQTQLDCKI